jgi:hypothetical protein
VNHALESLRAGVVALLAARRDDDLAAVVSRADLEIRPGESWAMGARSVTAHRVTLVVSADDYVALGADPTTFERLRAAFAQAMRSPDTELAELFVTLRLPPVGLPWQHVYRQAPVAVEPERPSPERVLAAARAFLQASGDAGAAAVLARAELESIPIAGSSPPLAQLLVRLPPADAAAVLEPVLEERVTRALRLAGARADERVASVTYGLLSSRGGGTG